MIPSTNKDVFLLLLRQHDTMEAVLNRGEKLDDLVGKSEELSAQSKTFYKTVSQTVKIERRTCCISCPNVLLPFFPPSYMSILGQLFDSLCKRSHLHHSTCMPLQCTVVHDICYNNITQEHIVKCLFGINVE